MAVLPLGPIYFYQSKGFMHKIPREEGRMMESKRDTVEREQTTIRLPVELKEELQKQAAEMGMSFNGFFLWLIDIGRRHLPQ